MLTATEEAQVKALIAQNAALLSLASSEPTIISKLAATKVSLADLTAASTVADSDLFLVRQGLTEKSVSKAILAAGITPTDASTTAKGIVELATVAEAQAGTSTTLAVTPAGLSAAAIPPGAVVYFPQSTAPTGFIKANGALVSRTTYAALFAAIGTTFGAGNGSTTFGLPDLRGEFVRGWDDARGIDSGREFGSAQAATVESHFHMTDGTNGSNPHAVYNGVDGSFDHHSSTASAADADYKGGTKTGTYGGTETRPRNIALLACIKF